MRKITLFICLCIVWLSAAQPRGRVEHISINNGLVQGEVNNILQDRKGFIWFSTWSGLSKYDGYTFKNYKASAQPGYPLTNNRITFFAESGYGDIWCQSYDGKVHLFDTRAERFIDVMRPIEEPDRNAHTVRKIYVLPKGIVWVVYENGQVYRIDERYCKTGEGIERYPLPENISKGKQILNIYQDSESKEWILTDRGVFVAGDKHFDTPVLYRYLKENAGKIYLASAEGDLACYDAASKTLAPVSLPETGRLYSMNTIGHDTLALATDCGLILLLPDRTIRAIDIRCQGQPAKSVHSFYEDREKNIWLFTPTPGITRLNLATGDKQQLSIRRKNTEKYERDSRNIIFEDQEGTIWLCPQKESFCYYDKKSGKLSPFLLNTSDPRSAYTPMIRRCYIDRQHNIWIAGQRGADKLTLFPSTYRLQDLDDGFEARAFLRDSRNRLWVSSKNNIIRLYDEQGELKGYLSAQGKIVPQEVKFVQCAYCFAEDGKGNIWIGTKNNGLFRLQRENEKSYRIRQFKHDPKQPYSIGGNSIYSIYPDRHGNIWIGSYGSGVNCIPGNGEEGKFIHAGNRLKNYPPAAMNVRFITEAPDGTLLAGTTNGLLAFGNDIGQAENIRFYRNLYDPERTSSLRGNDIMYIFSDSRQDTYVMSFTGGIGKIVSPALLSDSIRFKTYTTHDGLASDLALSMTEDRNGNLWVITENALSRFDPANGVFENYSNRFFRLEVYFSEAAPCITSQGEFILGTNRGPIRISPQQMEKSKDVPPLVFTELKIQGETSAIPIDEQEKITLSPDERNVTFRFAALDFIDPKEIRYAYRLKGLEQTWNEADNSRTASYINLPPGEYTLQIRSTNSDGVWIDNLRELPLYVTPTFWETPWAWLFYAVLFILLVGIIVYILFYIYRLRHQVDMEQQLADVKLRFFTDISHELRTPLTLIASPVTEVLTQEELSPTARQHLTLVHKNTERMLRLVNQILDFRKIQNRKMNLLLEETDIVAQLQRIMDNFRLIAEEKAIDFSFKSEQESLAMWVDRDKFEKIFFNLLSNAFKYTPEGKSVSVTVAQENGYAVVTVADKGIGIDPKKQHALFKRFETLVHQNILQPSSGIGLSLVNELVELHHGSIEVESQLGKGSAFKVRIPTDRTLFETDPRAEFILNDTPSSGKEIQPQASEESSVHPAGEDRLSVLIVEDNPELRSFLRNILSNEYSVSEAANGEEGLRMAEEYLPDLIVSDVMMPVMDGLDMVSRIKTNREICHIPIILLSAKSSLDDRIAGLEHDIDDYITKPFSATYLKTRIRSLLRQREQLQKTYLEQLLRKGKTESKENLLTPSQPVVASQDELFMQQAMEFMEAQMDNAELTIDDFAVQLGVSRTILYRKMKSIVGVSPVDFIREIRIKRAVQLLDSGEYNISQIAYQTGFSDPKYFSKCFKKQTGMNPTEYKANVSDKPKT